MFGGRQSAVVGEGAGELREAAPGGGCESAHLTSALHPARY